MHNTRTPKPSNEPASEQHAVELTPWRDVLFQAFIDNGGEMTKQELNARFEGHPKTVGRRFWKELISHHVQLDGRYVRSGTGRWALRSKFSEEELASLDAARLVRWPLRKA